MTTVIYGGSFNPPHLGHVSAAQSVYEALRPDRFLIIPTNIAPHKAAAAGSPDAAARLQMCKLAFAGIPGAEVSPMEMEREGKSYTADTISILREKYPEDELYLVVGTDMFLSFREWHEYEYLLDNCTLAVLSRETDDRGEILSFKRSLENEDGARIRLIEHEPLPMSSAEIRAMLPKAGGAELLDDGVYSLIIKNRWYAAKPELQWLREKVRPYLTEKRARHVAGCEEQAVKLARRWGADVYEAAEAGILHDITKKLSDEEQLIMCDKYGIILDAAERRNPRILHARTGAALARELFRIPDGIYSAIRWHTTGKPDMSLMEKIIYLADFTEPTRDFEGVEPLRKLCFEDIDRAMELGLRMSLEEIRSRGEDAYKDTVDAYQWYKKKQGGSATC